MALERQILTRTEPTIALDDLQFKSNGEEDGKALVSKDLGVFLLRVVKHTAKVAH